MKARSSGLIYKGNNIQAINVEKRPQGVCCIIVSCKNSYLVQRPRIKGFVIHELSTCS